MASLKLPEERHENEVGFQVDSTHFQPPLNSLGFEKSPLKAKSATSQGLPLSQIIIRQLTSTFDYR